MFQNHPTDHTSFALVAMAALVLLVFGSAIVTVIAYSFRRDQYVNARIRKQAGIIGPDKAFPTDYDPSRLFKHRIGTMAWLPGIFFVFFLVLPLFQLVILVSYRVKRELYFTIAQPDILDTITVIAGLASFVFSFSLIWWFGRKLNKKMTKWENEKSRPSERATGKHTQQRRSLHFHRRW